jgi:hypothetical protein
VLLWEAPFIDFAHYYTYASIVRLGQNPFDPQAVTQLDALLAIRRAGAAVPRGAAAIRQNLEQGQEGFVYWAERENKRYRLVASPIDISVTGAGFDAGRFGEIFRPICRRGSCFVAGKQGRDIRFLGPNGAGKTTTIRMLCCLISKTSGTLKIDDLSLDNKGDHIKIRKKSDYYRRTSGFMKI